MCFGSDAPLLARMGGVVVTVCMCWTMAVALPSRTVMSQAFAPGSDFEAMTPAQLSTLQVKLTYVGVQMTIVPSLMFTAESNTIDVNVFLPFQ